MNGQVRKLLQGPPKEGGMVYIVGQKTKIGMINEILLDVDFFTQYNILLWNVYIETPIGTQLWKQIPCKDCTVEYNLS